MIHNSNKKVIGERKIDDDNVDKRLFVYFLMMRHIILAMSKESQKFWNDRMQILKHKSEDSNINLSKYGFPVE